MEAQDQIHQKVEALIAHAGILVRGRAALLAKEKIRCPNTGRELQLFETSSPETVRSYLKGRRPIPFSVLENLRHWLKIRFDFSAPKDLFSASFDDQSEFLEHARNGLEKLVFDLPKFERSEFQFLEYHIDALRFGIERGGQKYLSDARFQDAKIHVGEISDFLSGTSAPPRELVSKLGQVFQSIESCGGCGKGIDELVRLEAVFRKVWQRRDEITVSLEDNQQFVGLANILAKMNHLDRLKGDNVAAFESANFIHEAAVQGHLGAKGSADRLELETRTRESLVGTVGFAELLDSVGEFYGAHSTQYLGILQCSACQAVFNAGNGTEGAASAWEKIARARKAISDAKSVVSRTGNGDFAAVHGREKDLDFIQVSYIERKYRGDPDRLDHELRRYGVDKLLALREATPSPIRRAKVNYWIWRAEGRNRMQRLSEALDLLNSRTEVASLCVLDVAEFREEIERELSSATP